MLREQAVESREKTAVHPLNEFSSYTDRKVTLVREGPSRAHQLLEVGLDGTDNLVPIFVHVHLANVVELRMWLGAVAWTKLEKQDVAHRGECQLQDLLVDLRAKGLTIRPGRPESKAGRHELNWFVLECFVQQLLLNIGRG